MSSLTKSECCSVADDVAPKTCEDKRFPSVGAANLQC